MNTRNKKILLASLLIFLSTIIVIACSDPEAVFAYLIVVLFAIGLVDANWSNHA